MASDKDSTTQTKSESPASQVKRGERKANSFIYAHGGRKTASARVRLYNTNKEFFVNDKPIGQYFPSKVWESFWQKPFLVTNTLGKVGATVRVSGSGKSSQLDAVVHGFSRALVEFDSSLRPKLRNAGLLTRDPRAKERRKYGLAQKARKGKQSPRR